MVVQENRDLMIAGLSRVVTEMSDAARIVVVFFCLWSVC
jgi:hypothetical protein